MKIILYGGTSEGRILAGRLAGQGHEITVSVATDVGAEELLREGNKMQILVGRMDTVEMEAVIEKYDICIDATHPYAVEATANIKAACEKTGIGYIRLLRDAERCSAPEGPAVDSYNHDAAAPGVVIPDSKRQQMQIREAADAGIHAVKFQTYKAGTLAAKAGALAKKRDYRHAEAGDRTASQRVGGSQKEKVNRERNSAYKPP